MFKLTGDQHAKANEWAENHSCTITAEGAIGGKTTYSFTQTSIGIVEKMTCACGKELDLTDYELW